MAWAFVYLNFRENLAPQVLNESGLSVVFHDILVTCLLFTLTTQEMALSTALIPSTANHAMLTTSL